MDRAGTTQGTEVVSEMEIVDIFTRLIFGEEANFSEPELCIIQALRLADSNITLDTSLEMGAYLRSLGVDEMIKLVSQVQQRLSRGAPLMVNPTAIVERRSRPRYL